MPHYDVAGKVALITGGAQGIGLATAGALRRRGAKVVVVDLDPDSTGGAAAQLGAGEALGIAADVTDREAINGAVEQAVERFGGVDIVMANAGIAPKLATTRAMATEEFERVVEVNLLGVYRTVRAAFDQIVQRQGQAVLVSSVYAFVNGMLQSPYAVAKAGVEQLGRALRVELAPHHASALVAYFGFVDTQMVRSGLDEDPIGRQAMAAVPRPIRGRITPEEAGEAVARAIERRRARVIAPRYWVAMSVLRGVINPGYDLVTAHAPRVRELLREADVEGRGAGIR